MLEKEGRHIFPGVDDALGAPFPASPLRNERGLTVGALLLLILLAAGTAWWILRTPTKSPDSPHASPQPSASARSGRSSPHPPAIPPPPPAARLADPAAPPATATATPLQTISDLIKDGRITEAESLLNDIPPSVWQDERGREYASALWNNLGVAKERKAGASAALSAYRAATTLDPASTPAWLNLAQAYLETKDPALTREFLERLIAMAPDEMLPHLALADLLFDKDDLAGATRHLEQATQRVGKDASVHAYMEAITAKVAQAEKAERRFSSRESSHFVVKFDGTEEYDTWTRVVGILEDAYRDIGQKFSYFPQKPVMVVLHTKAAFSQATGSPAWADGLFDPILGRIQIPTQGALTDQAWLTRVLRHEFVHALLHQRMDGQLGAVPTWFNEGLAMQLAGDAWPDLDQIARGDIRLIPLVSLEGGWTGLAEEAAMVAYLEGNSATRFLIERYGMSKVQDILSELAKRQSIAAAMHERLFLSYEDFQRRWVNELNGRLEATKS
jgi:tetratricopeptide (TPR) repeat protein